MAKGYWIANNIVQNADQYDAYRVAIGPVLARYGARFISRGGPQEVKEGTAFPRTVVIEFDSYETALTCYEDPEYQNAKRLRLTASDGTLTIFEGYDG
ncbi:MAG: hypothetical protein ACJA1E_001285 [Paracoccaceae bacterium]|jgi:uncharacterized protein (DUF1330 family)